MLNSGVCQSQTCVLCLVSKDIQHGRQNTVKNAISTVFCYSQDFHKTFLAFLLFHSIIEICEAFF